MYKKVIEEELARAQEVPLSVIKIGGVEIILFRADALSAGVKNPIGPGLVAAYLDQGLINDSTRALVVHGSGNTASSVKMAVDRFELNLRVAAIVYVETSQEKQQKLRSRGIEVYAETFRSEGRGGRMSIAKKLLRRRGWLLIEQHEQPMIVGIHSEVFGQALVQKLGSKPTHFIAGVGTGGTLFGTASALKRVNPEMKTIAIEGLGSTLTLWRAYLGVKKQGYEAQKTAIEEALEKYQMAGMKVFLKSHPRRRDSDRWFEIDVETPPDRVVGIEGLGVGDPSALILDHLLEVDDVRIVTDEQAEFGQAQLKGYGISAVTSAGANFFTAIQLAKKLDKGRIITIVTAHL